MAKPNTSPAMKDAWRLFDSGDKVRARKKAQDVLAQPASDEDAQQARELLQRTQVPPLAWALAGAVLLVATLLIVIAVTRV